MSIHFLKLLQISDSAFPIGGTAHSFGLETLVADGRLRAEGVERFLGDFLGEVAASDAAFCCAAHRLASAVDGQDSIDPLVDRWSALSAVYSSYKPARESRAASSAMGRRFAGMLMTLEPDPTLGQLLTQAKERRLDLHHALAFGFACGLHDVDEEQALLAYLQQSVTGLLSACQRLMPLGQSHAMQILWRLKPEILYAVEQGQKWCNINCISPQVQSFNPMVEIASMRHPTLPVRLFIS